MIAIVKNGDITNPNVKEYVADTISDISNLPDREGCGVGSTCFVASDSSKYILNSNNEWKKMKTATGGGTIVGGAANVFIADVLEGESDIDAIARVAADATLANGDIAIARRSEKDYTAYVYCDDAWVAMTGNYNAKDVYFDQNLQTTSAIGNINLENGQAEVKVKGKNLIEAWETIFVKEDTDIQVTQPTASMTVPNTQYFEIGKSGSTSVTVVYEDGKYEYGYTTEESVEEGHLATITVNNGTTGATATAYHVTYNGAPLSGSGNKFTVESGTKKTNASMAVNGSVDYKQGYIPVSNLKKMYASKRIAAGTANASAKTLFYWYIPMYHGFDYTGSIVNPTAITSSEIQKLTKITGSTAYNKKVPTNETATQDWKQYFIAVPAEYNKKKPSITDSNGLPLTVEKANDVTINYEGTAIIYSVYFVNLDAAYKTHKINLVW